MSDYDMKIHSSNSAQDWARFFIKTKNETNFVIDEGLMISWFANAMMAMSDHIHNNQIQALQKENERLRKGLWDIVEDLYTPYRIGISEKPNPEWAALKRAKQILKEITTEGEE